MVIEKAVVIAGGLGTRLLPVSKKIPKEMLPLLSVSNGVVGLKPVIHIVFESLFNVDIREFCVVVDRGKRVLEDYFTPDTDFVELLESRGLSTRVEELKRFYSMVSQSRIFFVNQPTPRGFGDAVLRAEPFVGDKPFVLHAGDDVVVNGDYDHLKRLFRAVSYTHLTLPTNREV